MSQLNKVRPENLALELEESANNSSRANQKETGLRAVNEFPRFADIKHGELLGLSLTNDTSTLTHSTHRFPAKYIPQIPRWAIREFTDRQSIVLDPFMGSGTTLVEGLCHVERSIGIDVDPLAKLISTAKTSRYDIARLNALAGKLSWPRRSPSTDFLSVPMEGVVNFEHWFTRNAWADLQELYKKIIALECEDHERIFFLCVFSSILRRVSNADDQTQKTYVSGTLAKTPPLVRDTFDRALRRGLSAVQALEEVRMPQAVVEIYDGSALDIPLKNATVDLVVTSPPYLDSVDYMYNFMLEYFWLGPQLGVATRTDFNVRRRQSVGAKNPTSTETTLPIEISDLVSLDLIPQYRRAAVLAYFDAMCSHFREASRVLKAGGRYVLVIGNSQAQNGAIPIHDCLVRLAGRFDLYLEKAFGYRIRRHYMKFPRKGRGGIILMDWVIVLQKANAPLMPLGRLPLPEIKLGIHEVAN